jgi:hypothetical protein
MSYIKFLSIASALLLMSAVTFAQPDGGFGGGFPPMGMGQMNESGQQNNQSRKMITEGVDLSTLSLISSEQAAKLIEQLQKKIEKHNKTLLSKFDTDKDGKLDKRELKNWKSWLNEQGVSSAAGGFMGGGMPQMPDSMMRKMQQGNMGGGGMPNGSSSMAGDQNMPNGNNGMPGGMPPGGGMNQAKITPLAANAISKVTSLSSKTFSSDKANESVLRVGKGAKLSTDDVTVKKLGGNTTSEEQSNFYGLNAAVAVDAGGTANISGGSVFTNAEGANAIFAYGKEAKITIDNLNIDTQKNSSRGLDATYGGSINASNVTISTKGAHCAALATDRGEGTVAVTNCNAKTEGDGSPGIYSTGDISANNSIFYAGGSEAAVIEGKNSIHLDGCTLTGSKSCGIMLYQSFSGDAGVGTSVLSMKNSKLTALAGPLFYCTNTNTKVVLENDELIGHTGVLLHAAGGQRWGQQGKNGAQVNFTAKAQVLEGSMTFDNLSGADITFGNGTYFTGSINSDNQSQQVNLTLVKGSKWVMTADSYVQQLTVSGQTLEEAMKSIQTNGHQLKYTKTTTK